MAVSLKHKYVSGKSDVGDTSLVRPSNWNDEHDLTLATGRLLGRTTAGTGVAEEISAGTGLTLSGGTLSVTTNTYQPLDSELTAIAGLASAADRLPYFTGSGTAALATFTTAGRNLIDDADASAQRTTLGLGTAATLNVGTGANNVVQLDGSARLPAVDGSQLTNLPAPTPPGALMPYAGTTEPSGWLFCYGQAVSRTTYAALFAALSTTYGAGDGSTTFNLPDMRGRTVAGRDNMGGVSANRLTNQPGGLDGDTLGAVGGAETHTLTVAQIPSHTHSISSPWRMGSGSASSSHYETSPAGNTTHISPANTGSGDAHNIVQPTISLNYIIKT